MEDKYVNISLTFNEALYLKKILKTTRQTMPANMFKYPISASKFTWAGKAPIEKESSIEMLASMKSLLDTTIELYLGWPECNEADEDEGPPTYYLAHKED